MIKVLFIILGIIGIVAFGCAYLGRYTEIFKDGDKVMVTGVIIGFVSVFVMLILGFATGINQEPKTDDSRPKKYTACENKSDTYYKCNWSVWEDRCVCKQR